MKILLDEDKKKVIKRYQERIQKYGVSYDSLASGSIEKQEIRCRTHLKSIKTEKPEILDIGCGIGYFYDFLQRNSVRCNYTGYDILPEYIEKCKDIYPQARFMVRDIFEEGIDKIYDNIVISQVFNNKYTSSNNWEVMLQVLKITYEHTRIGVSIDMMSSYVDYQSEELYYYSPELIFKEAKKIAKRVVLYHDYRPYEFCIQLFHPEAPDYVM